MKQLRRDDAVAAGITAGLAGLYFALPVFLWFPIVVAVVLGIAVKTGLK